MYVFCFLQTKSLSYLYSVVSFKRENIYIALIYFPPCAIIYFREMHTSLSGFEHFVLQL